MDVVVAGGGLAGLVAALQAAELGARVTLLEKGDRLGGSFLYSSGYIWSYKDLRTFRKEAPGGDVALQRLILERLETDLGWLEGLGAPALTRATDNPLSFGAQFGAERVVATLSERIVASGGRLLVGTALNGLVQDPECRIEGVRAVSGEEQRAQRADAVVLASGGFGGNPELVRSYIIGGSGRMRLRANPWSTGEGFLAALEAGALASAGLDEFYGRNLPAPPAEFPPERFVEVSQLYGRHAVAINARGKRYADEGADWSETALTRATAHQPGLYAYYVLDAKGLQVRVRERTVKEMVEVASDTGGTVVETTTLEELADRLGALDLPREALFRTLENYNVAVASGKDISPPRTGLAIPLREPPFVAVKVAPYITHTVGGLVVDARCRVLRELDAGPIPGLYAAGVEVGGVSAGGYTSGLASALVFGRTAAESAAVADGLK